MSTYLAATLDVSTTRLPEKSNDLLFIVIRAVSAFMQVKVKSVTVVNFKFSDNVLKFSTTTVFVNQIK